MALGFILPMLLLQFYWGRLLVRQALKALAPSDDTAPAKTAMV